MSDLFKVTIRLKPNFFSAGAFSPTNLDVEKVVRDFEKKNGSFVKEYSYDKKEKIIKLVVEK